jgi:ABC-type dipeptide/oligopeptide/nickel transport system permease component
VGKSWLRTYIIKRLIYAVIIAWGIVTVTFMLIRIGPGSPADKYLANMATSSHDVSQITAAIEARYGLDKPLWEQYTDYMGHLFKGDLGYILFSSFY